MAHAAERCVVYECAQQIIVAGAWLVRAGENSVNDVQSAVSTDPMRGHRTQQRQKDLEAP
jgi:hypothetical protein